MPNLRSHSLTALAVLGIALGGAGFSHAVSRDAALPAQSPEGLRLVQNTKMAVVYLKDGADFSSYDKVAILDCFVAFRKDWERDQNQDDPFRVRASDITRIKTDVADEFKKVFSKELTAKGETVVETAGADVLLLRPAIINLDIAAPDTKEPDARSFSASGGQMTLFLEIYDSVSSELLARIMDPEAATDFGSMMVRNEVTNKADADRIMKKWADTLGSYLQHARSGSSAKP